MFRRFILYAGLAAALSFTAVDARADGEKEPGDKDSERSRVESSERRPGRVTPPRRMRYGHASRVHRHRHVHRHVHHHRYVHRGYHRGYRAWDGRYAAYPRRHFFVSGVHTHGYYGIPVNYATVTYRTYVYYTPTYPSLSHAYPPYAHLYNLTRGPIYNKPCLC